jgi:hypothetical protein
MTGIFAIQYWLIFFMMVGLCCTRPQVSRLAFSVVTLAIGRFFVRSVVLWIGGPNNPAGDLLGADPLILILNFGVLAILFSELVTGQKLKKLKKLKPKMR